MLKEYFKKIQQYFSVLVLLNRFSQENGVLFRIFLISEKFFFLEKTYNPSFALVFFFRVLSYLLLS
jgi:hypothetical protein